jgi:SSS family solute:Na+ symporter
VYTLPDILKNAYGERVAVPAALMISVSWCGVIAAQMIAGARLLDGVFLLGYVPALAIVAAVFVVYSYWGGQLSVVRTDSWQLMLFAGGLLLCLALVAANAIGSDGTLANKLPPEFWSFPVSAEFGWYELLVYYPLIVGLPFLVGPDLWSRILCARDKNVARRSVFFAAAAIVPIALLLALLGILIRASFPDVVPDAALPEAIRHLLPIGIRGLIAAGFLAAIMSSADTTLVTASTILSLNVVSPLRPLSEVQRLRLTRVCLVLVGAIAWIVAGFQQAIIPALLLGYTIYVGGVVVPTLASFFRDRLGVTATGAMWAVIVGGSTAILGEMRDGAVMRAALGTGGDSLLESVLGPLYPSILPVVLSVLVLIVVSKLAASNSDREALVR